MPRTGFERYNEGELLLSAGNFGTGDADLSFGSHTQRFAYYVSVNGDRSDLGLQPPVPQIVHDADNGYGGFSSLIFNIDHNNQLRLVTSLRKDYFQVPYDPNPNDIENGSIAANGFSPQYPSIGLRDGQHEADAGINFSWVHTFNSQVMLTVSPFYHYNSGDYASSPDDTPVATTQDRGSTYAGGQATVSANFYKNNLQAGYLQLLPAGQSVLRRDLQRWQREWADRRFGAPNGQSRNILRGREVHAHSLADADCGHAADSLFRR